ncbi:MAG TPA: hypothetical protein ENF18_00495 [candidate division WOR-3 bacterium]|uniref:Uncharacterized protein n=1 Tax=candidate division WOR-3 bacterium TaxID=2052148 RepID=A0A7C0VA13_UNCW3|nr:hypothetical protein [candidate division WOR-3 bacterium]
MKKIDIITGDIPLIKRIFYRFKKRDRETRELKMVWDMLELVPEPPMVYTPKNTRKLLYPAFALGFLGLLIGLYLGVKSEPYNDYLAITQEVINYGE